METSSYAVIGSIITSSLVIIVPVFKGIFDQISEKKNRVFDNELKVKREVYEEFLISASRLGTMDANERHEFISCAMKACLYCDRDVKKKIMIFVQTVEDMGRDNPDSFNKAVSFASSNQDPKVTGFNTYIDHYIIFEISDYFKNELDEIISKYSDNHVKRLWIWLTSKLYKAPYYIKNKFNKK